MSAGTSSVLPNNTYANPIQELWEPAGGGGGGGAGVLQIVAGTNVTISPLSGEGVVTINASGGGAGGVTSIVAGTGISASAPSGDVTLTNTGVTSLVAGTNVVLSGATGAVTVSVPTSTPASFVYFGDFVVQGNGPALAFSYTKIGRVVTVDGRFKFDTGSGSGTFSLPPATIAQLPPAEIGNGLFFNSVLLLAGSNNGNNLVTCAGDPTSLGSFGINWAGGSGTTFVRFSLTYVTA